MKIINLVPNTPEWLEHRRFHHNASEGSIMMAASKYVSRNDLLHMKATGTEREFSDWFQKNVLDNGHAVEAKARPIAEKIIGDELYPISATDDEGWLAATYDGMTMDRAVNWECKQWNKEKAADVQAGCVPGCDYWQVVHQLVINEGSKTLYMVTDGTEENTVHIWVELDEDDAAKLIGGWRQFEKDLAAYVPKESKPEVVGAAPETLPALRIEAQGMVTASNLQEFEKQARAVLASINMDLKTDQDFADAEKTVKWIKDVEDRLESAKQSVLAQTATIDEVFRVIDSIKDEGRDKRLVLEKEVKKQKESRKAEIIANARANLQACIGDLVASVKQYMPDIQPDFAGAIKGKKKLDAMESAVDDVLAKAKVEVHETANLIQNNLAQLDEHAADYRFLFNDLAQHVTKPAGDFAAVVKTRVADYQAEQKAQAEREQQAQQDAAATPETVADPTPEQPQQDLMPSWPKGQPSTLGEYEQGYIDGLTEYAHWKDGVQYVGTCGRTLEQAINDFLKLRKAA